MNGAGSAMLLVGPAKEAQASKNLERVGSLRSSVWAYIRLYVHKQQYFRQYRAQYSSKKKEGPATSACMHSYRSFFHLFIHLSFPDYSLFVRVSADLIQFNSPSNSWHFMSFHSLHSFLAWLLGCLIDWLLDWLIAYYFIH